MRFKSHRKPYLSNATPWSYERSHEKKEFSQVGLSITWNAIGPISPYCNICKGGRGRYTLTNNHLQSRRNFGDRFLSNFSVKIIAAISYVNRSGRLERERNLNQGGERRSRKRRRKRRGVGEE